MESKTLNTSPCKVNKELTFHHPSGHSFPIFVQDLTVIKEDDVTIEVNLSFRVSPEVYQRLEAQEAFNLFDHAFGLKSKPSLSPDQDVVLETVLMPTLLENLVMPDESVDEVGNYLSELAEKTSDSALLSLDNWYCLRIKQKEKGEEVTYRTIWDYFSFPDSLKDEDQEALFSQAMMNFYRAEIADPDSPDVEMEEQVFEAVVELAKNINEDDFEELGLDLDGVPEEEFEEKFMESFSDLVEACRNESTKALPSKNNESSNQSAFQLACDFFEEEDWSFTKDDAEPGLSMNCKGKNGNWDVYAWEDEDAEVFTFYSILPLKVIKTKFRQITEFITRVNNKLTLGNFEFDFDTGTISYKTALSFRKENLDKIWIKDIVYPNFSVTDKYLPGFEAIINNHQSAKKAIALIDLELEE